MNQTPQPRGGGQLRALVALNAVLLALLAVVTLAPSVDAQARARGSYTMVAGRAPGAEAAVVYIVDTINQELIAVNYNANTNQIDGVGYRSLAADAAEAFRGARSRN